ncbi:MAG: NAD-dependent succinate-semialdehyde dehydrogenase [Opitutaceae bacterium]|nr:NAD-dependent succinate-semialdehyde dehydrogenase [Opitutaceae bacterium]
MSLVSINPATGRKIRAYREFTPAQVMDAVAHAHAAFQDWRHLRFTQRAAFLRAVARELRRSQVEYALLATEEMGKPISQSLPEIEKCAACFDYFAANGSRFLADESAIDGNHRRAFVTYQPLGVILAIMPWNFPYWQACRAAAPALMAGNVMLLKHSSNVTGCALAIEQAFVRAGLPRGVFQALPVGSPRVEGLIRHPHVRAVTLTGSTEAGKRVASVAGSVMKKGVFELGGSDPYVILEDADLPTAAEICAASRLINSGQSCVAAKRFIVVERVRKKFERLFIESMAAHRTGDPRVSTTEIGPLARADLRSALHAQVQASIRRGARLALGGKISSGPGYFYPPTVLTGVQPGMPAYHEELFGPVAAIIPARNEAAAIRIANDSPYGLGSAVFTRNRRRGERIAREQLEAGLAYVNGAVQSQPALPFGGVKDSGYGRELGLMGIREFVNTKTILVA